MQATLSTLAIRHIPEILIDRVPELGHTPEIGYTRYLEYTSLFEPSFLILYPRVRSSFCQIGFLWEIFIYFLHFGCIFRLVRWRKLSCFCPQLACFCYVLFLICVNIYFLGSAAVASRIPDFSSNWHFDCFTFTHHASIVSIVSTCGGRKSKVQFFQIGMFSD